MGKSVCLFWDGFCLVDLEFCGVFCLLNWFVLGFFVAWLVWGFLGGFLVLFGLWCFVFKFGTLCNPSPTYCAFGYETNLEPFR